MGDLEYQYDADGRVIQKTGSFAQTKLPVTVTGNTFNAANEMTAFNGIPQTYDPNGNLTNDGTNTYTWDTRNHLTTIAGAKQCDLRLRPARTARTEDHQRCLYPIPLRRLKPGTGDPERRAERKSAHRSRY